MTFAMTLDLVLRNDSQKREIKREMEKNGIGNRLV
jgi:hypothetical protein